MRVQRRLPADVQQLRKQGHWLQLPLVRESTGLSWRTRRRVAIPVICSWCRGEQGHRTITPEDGGRVGLVFGKRMTPRVHTQTCTFTTSVQYSLLFRIICLLISLFQLRIFEIVAVTSPVLQLPLYPCAAADYCEARPCLRTTHAWSWEVEAEMLMRWVRAWATAAVHSRFL